MCDLFLLRHGETAGQSSIRFYGATDIELSEIGEQQMSRAGDILGKEKFKTVIVSPMRRSIESTAIVLDGRKYDPVVVNDFREINFGEWEGLTAEEIADLFPDAYREWKETGTMDRFPGGDSKTEFYTRVGAASQEVFNGAETPVLAVLHKGVIRGILSALLDVPVTRIINRRIELGSIHRLSRSPDGWKLVTDNETGHLGEYRMEHS